MPDKNYPSGDFSGCDRVFIDGLVLEPPDQGAGLDDIFKVSNCTNSRFSNIEVRAGFQSENAQDLNRESCHNEFANLVLDAGLQGAILGKGGSSYNSWKNVLIRKPTGHSDVMIGGYSEQSKKTSVGNTFDLVSREDGKPVRVAWTFIRAEKPKFTNSKVEYQYGWSLIRTIYTELKYAFPSLIP